MIPERLYNGIIWLGLIAFGLLAYFIDEPYWLTLATRAMIFAIAGLGLNLVLGYGGMISFGHAAFFGIGGYAVGILATHAQTYDPIFAGFITLTGTQFMPYTWAIAVIAGGIGAALIGAISLRTQGAYFIMITLAFGQMFYYFAISWPAYGGEDGMSIYLRGSFPGANTLRPFDFFWVTFGVLTAVILLIRTLNASPFGLSLNAVRQTPERVETVGISPFRLRMTAFVISGMITALAGALFADLNKYVSPSMFSWTISGEIMIFVILGGVARLMGPVVGAIVFVTLEELLGGISDYWHLYLGILLLLIVLFAKGGITGALTRKTQVQHG